MNFIAPMIWKRLYHSGRVFLTYFLIYQQVFMGVVWARGHVREDTYLLIQLSPVSLKGQAQAPEYTFSIHRRHPLKSQLSKEDLSLSPTISVELLPQQKEKIPSLTSSEFLHPEKATIPLEDKSSPLEATFEPLFETQVFPSLGVWNNTGEGISLIQNEHFWGFFHRRPCRSILDI